MNSLILSKIEMYQEQINQAKFAFRSGTNAQKWLEFIESLQEKIRTLEGKLV